MTNEERGLVLDLADVFEAFLKLPAEESIDQQDFRTSIYRCQRIILARAARRDLNRTFDLTPSAGQP